MAKPYMTIEDQIKQLRDERGLTCGDNVSHIIELEGYYPVVNGYKDPFLESISPERYKHGSCFEDIYTLFKLDRELRLLLIRFLILIEQRFKATLCRVFSKHNQESEAYLNINSYSRYSADKRDQLIETLIKQKEDTKKKYIVHYREAHNEVPIWVLANNLTFGIAMNLYFCLDYALQDEVAKELSLSVTTVFNGRKIFRKELRELLIVASHLRNICAHDDRLYNEKAIVYDKKHPVNNKEYNFNESLQLISILLSESEKELLFERLLTILRDEFKFSDDSVKLKILNDMGFDAATK